MGGKKVRKHYAVEDRLPEDIRAQVDRLLIEGATYDEVQAWLDGQGHDISRSAIGRYGKDFLAAYQRLRMVEDQARTLVSEAGDGLVLEEAASKLFGQQIIEGLVSAKIDVTTLPRLVSDFAKLAGASVQRERLKADLKNKADKAVKKVEKQLTDLSIPEDKLAYIKEVIYGIAS